MQRVERCSSTSSSGSSSGSSRRKKHYYRGGHPQHLDVLWLCMAGTCRDLHVWMWSVKICCAVQKFPTAALPAVQGPRWQVKDGRRRLWGACLTNPYLSGSARRPLHHLADSRSGAFRALKRKKYRSEESPAHSTYRSTTRSGHVGHARARASAQSTLMAAEQSRRLLTFHQCSWRRRFASTVSSVPKAKLIRLISRRNTNNGSV
mmetsp:Transcript_71177/g.137349  ORF Transcript_71177/g.137349 Transcript_71177/m.137349 type:complete len:205 (-) Transcript_71177:1454-2068(-)